MTFLDFMENLNEAQSSLIGYLDKQFLAQEGITRKMRFRIPFYDYNKWICYLNPVKKSQVELCFLNGIAMHEHFPSLDVRGRKKVSGLMIYADQDVPIALIIDMLEVSKSLANTS